MTPEENTCNRGYPCTYKVDRTTRRFVHGFGIFLVAFFLVMTPLHLLGAMKHPLSLFQLALIDVSVAAFVVWASLRVERRVTLYEDGIEVAGWSYSRKLRRDQILGRRMGKLAWQAGGGLYYIIVPSDRQKRELKLPVFLYVDKHFRAWIKEIPEVHEQRA